MYKGKSVAVVVPAYNEEKLIGKVIETTPDYVDYVVIVDDLSKDKTVDVVNGYIDAPDNRIVLICMEKNVGVGGAIAEGYKWCRDHQIDATAVMAGDAQMDPSDLPALLDPIVNGEADYTKGNRLFTGEAWHKIPKARYMGNAALSLLTKIASGYWHVADSQTGFTVANHKVLSTLDLGGIYKRYGMPNDMLVKLNIYNFRVRDVEIQPIYGIGEKSGIKPLLVIPKFTWLLSRLFFYRMIQKYVIRDFHPLIFFYFSGFAFSLIGWLLGLYLFIVRITTGPVAATSTIVAIFLIITGMQSLFFAMWFDMDSNKYLK
ncbi:MAG: glycosyltransferase family 2 protein [Brevefilum sp.]|nr:glycosyltransferase family 2 protein [Brevefilum sp.]MDW7753935.1 glycosyltransferase family 2 protein [Brevefilum sp.]